MSGSDELFYVDAAGRKQDDDLHAGMLLNAEADDEAALNAVIKLMDVYGLSETDALSCCGLPNTPRLLAQHRDGSPPAPITDDALRATFHPDLLASAGIAPKA